MKWSATLLLFLLLVSTSVTAFSEEVTSGVDKTEVRQVDNSNGAQAWVPVSLTRMTFESRSPEVVVFDNHIRPFPNADEEAQNYLMNQQPQEYGMEGSLAVTGSQRNAVLLCFGRDSTVSGLTLDADARE
jgi:hypothetical protein